MSLTRCLFALAAAATFLPAQAATTYDFQTVAGADAGSFVGCTSGDECATAVGGTMSFFAGAVGATGYYATTDARAMLDNFSDRPSGHPELRWVGLGVYHKDPLDNSDDNITNDERLVLSFDTAVVLDTAFLRAEGHYANFATGAKFGVRSSGGIVDFTLVNGQNLYDITSAGLGASKTWTFYGYSDDAMKQYYVGSVTAVPEPGSVALMAAGLCAIGFVARRRPARAA